MIKNYLKEPSVEAILDSTTKAKKTRDVLRKLRAEKSSGSISEESRPSSSLPSTCLLSSKKPVNSLATSFAETSKVMVKEVKVKQITHNVASLRANAPGESTIHENQYVSSLTPLEGKSRRTDSSSANSGGTCTSICSAFYFDFLLQIRSLRFLTTQ